MNRAIFNKFVEDLHNQELDLTEAGQAEYAHASTDIFDNFNRVAAQIGVDRKKVLMVYLLKHMDGIMSYIKGYKSQRESVQGRIHDARVYLALLSAMIHEEENQDASA